MRVRGAVACGYNSKKGTMQLRIKSKLHTLPCGEGSNELVVVGERLGQSEREAKARGDLAKFL